MPNEDNRIYLEFPASEVKIELGETITFDNVSGFLNSGRVLYNDVSLTDELAHLENDKADADSVYSKTEIDNALDLKADKADTYTKTEIDSSLELKADKSNTYTKSEVDTLIDNLPEAMVFKGTLGVGGTIQTLPAASTSNEGWTYKVITDGTYSGQDAKSGDVFVSNGSAWVLIPSGDEDNDTWRAIKVNGTEKLGNAISSGSVDFVDTSDILVTFDTDGNKIKLTLVSPIPTKTSELQNDSGFTSIDDTQTANDKTWSSEKIANSIPDVSNYYNKEETDALLENKADKSELYNVYPTDEASGAIAHITDGADNIPVKSLVSEIVAVESGSGEKSPTNPYTISGFDNAVITRCGVNIWDEQWELGAYNTSNGKPTTTSNQIRSKNTFKVLPNTSYFAYISAGTIWAFFYDSNDNLINTPIANISQSAYAYAVGNKLFTTPSNATKMKFYCTAAYGTIYNHDISINYPPTDTEYHAYNGNTYTISFGQTVYGGRLNVTTGELTITHGVLDLGDIDWVYSTSGQYFQTQNEIADCKKSTSNYTTYGLICPIYQDNIWNTIGDSDYKMALGYVTKSYIRIINHDYTDVNSFKTAMSGVYLIYPLETPYIIQLTPTEVKTLLGENNIFSNTGDVEVNYCADIGLYIDKKISSLAQG